MSNAAWGRRRQDSRRRQIAKQIAKVFGVPMRWIGPSSLTYANVASECAAHYSLLATEFGLSFQPVSLGCESA